MQLAPATSNEGDHSEYGPLTGSREETYRYVTYLMTLLVAHVLNRFHKAQRQAGGEGGMKRLSYTTTKKSS